jgi:diguanylate cyclase
MFSLKTKKFAYFLLTIRFFLDMLIMMSVATTFNWIFIMNPLFNHQSNIVPTFADLLYPILDLGVLEVNSSALK